MCIFTARTRVIRRDRISDVDVFVDRDPTQRFTFIELTEIEFLLQATLGKNVDVSTRTGLHPAIRREIEQSAVRVV